MHDNDNDRPRTLLDILDRIFNADRPRAAPSRPSVDIEARDRSRYQEGLITELLTTLAGKGLLTNDEARAVIARAKERVAEKARTEDAPASSSPTGCLCPVHDMRPHKVLDCAGCNEPMPHLIEGSTARCRRCLTSRGA